ncbi:MAG: NADH-quinone oxidoreductase subunit M [Acidobacteria bacterium]|nr:NADH-quinone oxidoreductase subunit M [Acidobacteriota bacterium]MBI3662478.1 NADH-quinone oxidoreductase subunit M [Acidobacteriota bacterium]
MANEGYLLSVVTFLPLLGSLGLLALRGDDHTWIRRLALATALANFVLSLLLLHGFAAGTPGYQLEELRPWIHWPPINYHLGVDGLSLWLVILTTFLTPIAILCSWESIGHRVKEFFLMLLVLETGMIGVFLSLDLILFFVFWEVMLVPMYFLIGIWGHERRIYAAIKFVLYTMAGSVLMLVAILWLFGLSGASVPGGTFDLPTIQVLLQNGKLQLPHTTELLLFGAFFLAFAIKVPLFPLHTWLPDAHVEAPTAGSVILAGVLLKMGTYGLLRFCLPLFPAASKELAPWVAVLAMIGIVYGALVSMVQPDLKKLIAYSSVSHLGFVVLGIFSFHPVAIQGAIYQMLNHGISTGALFLIAGMLYDRRHTHLIKEFGGLATPMPALSAFFLFVCLSSLGLPMLNGFVGEFLILLGTYQVNKLWATFGALGVILAAVYLLWAYQRVAFGEVTVEKNRVLPDCSPRERLILWPLCVMILWMGIGSPVFLSRTETASQQVIEQMKRPQMPALAGTRGAVPQLRDAPAGAESATAVQQGAGPK